MSEGKARPTPTEADNGKAASIGIIVFIVVVALAVLACTVKWYARVKAVRRVVPLHTMEEEPEPLYEKPEKTKKEGGLLGRYAEAIRAEKERSANLSQGSKTKAQNEPSKAERKNPYERFERMKEARAQSEPNSTEQPSHAHRNPLDSKSDDEDEGFGDPSDWQRHSRTQKGDGNSQPETGGGAPFGSRRQSAPYSSTARSREDVGSKERPDRSTSAPQQNANYEDMPGWKEAYSKRFGATDPPPSDGPRAAGAAGGRTSMPYSSTPTGTREDIGGAGKRSQSPPPKENRERANAGAKHKSGTENGPRAAGTGTDASGSPPDANGSRQSTKSEPAPSPTRSSSKSAPGDEATCPTELADQLNRLRESLSAAEKKKHFAKLCLRWHPDKNADNIQHATAMFQMLQEKKEWFLKDS